MVGTFDTYEEAANVADELEEIGMWTNITSIRVSKDLNQVAPGSLIEIPGSNFLEPQLPYPFKGY